VNALALEIDNSPARPPYVRSRRWLRVTRWWLLVAIGFHIACALVLVPVTSHPYDLAVLTSNAEAWLRWGFSPFYRWKFGTDFAALALVAQALRAFIAGLGAPGIVALHIAWKLPLVSADLLTAGVIFRLGRKFVPSHASALAALWLVNPVVLWVSAGHGQVESIAILCLFAALQFALDGRLLLAGLVTGLGAGVEYFPIAALVPVIVWWRGGLLIGKRTLLSYSVGFVSSMAACFGPLLLDPIGRPSLLGGLASSSGLSPESVNSLLDVWAWFGYRWASLWPLLFVVGGIVCFAFAIRTANRGPGVGLIALSTVLLLAVLLDANTLPQFAVIAAAALWLLAMAVPMHPIALVVVPVAGLATYFLFLDNGASTANAFFFDAWANTGARLLPVPRSQELAILLGRTFSLSLVVATAYGAMGLVRARRPSWNAALMLGAMLCLVPVVWALQPPIWQSALSAAPTASLPDFDYVAGTRDGTISLLGPQLARVNYSETLIAASRQGRVTPTAGVRVSVRDLIEQASVGQALVPSLVADRTINIPDWSRLQESARTVWVELLLGSTEWSDGIHLDQSHVSLLVNGARIPADHATFVMGQPSKFGWALVDFLVPSAMIDHNGNLYMLPSPATLSWNGSQDGGPWVRVATASGAVHVLVDLKPATVSYRFDSNGLGYVTGFPLTKTYVIDLSDAELSQLQILGAVLRWPETSETWKSNIWFQALGVLFGLVVLAATTLLMARELRGSVGTPEVLLWSSSQPSGLYHPPNAMPVERSLTSRTARSTKKRGV
jgi:hypothetical protein